jgi:hypothetical protein
MKMLPNTGKTAKAHNPYAADVLLPGAVLYQTHDSQPAPGPTATVAVGQVPRNMKPDRLRWAIREVAGVDVWGVVAQRPFKGLFFIKVPQAAVPWLLACSGKALCVPSFLWLPPAGVDAAAVAQQLKDRGVVRNGLLTFSVSNSQVDPVPQ